MLQQLAEGATVADPGRGGRGGTGHPTLHASPQGETKQLDPADARQSHRAQEAWGCHLSPTWLGDIVPVPLTNVTEWPWSQEQGSINRACPAGATPPLATPGSLTQRTEWE